MTTQAKATLSPRSTLADVLEQFPGARRALFREYHIGGCSSCGFETSETVEELCQRNGGLVPAEMLAHLAKSHEQDQELLMPPADVEKALRDPAQSIHLLDIRPKEEWDTARIDDAVRLTQDNLQEIMSNWAKDDLLVICDHTGAGVLDAAAYFQGHGFSNVRCLRGGVDAWAQEIETGMKRYRLD